MHFSGTVVQCKCCFWIFQSNFFCKPTQYIKFYVEIVNNCFWQQRGIENRCRISTIGHLNLKEMAPTFNKASVQPHIHFCHHCYGNQNPFFLHATCIICFACLVKWFATMWQQHRCNLRKISRGVGWFWYCNIICSFLLSLHLIDEKVSANFNSAGSGKDCISPLTRQLIVFLYVLNGEGWWYHNSGTARWSDGLSVG